MVIFLAFAIKEQSQNHISDQSFTQSVPWIPFIFLPDDYCGVRKGGWTLACELNRKGMVASSQKTGALEISALWSCKVIDRNVSTSSIFMWKIGATWCEGWTYRTAATKHRSKGTPHQSAENNLQVLTKLFDGLPVGIGEPRTLLRIIYRVSRVPVGAPGLGHITPKGPLLRGFYQGNSDMEEARRRAPCCVPRELPYRWKRHSVSSTSAASLGPGRLLPWAI